MNFLARNQDRDNYINRDGRGRGHGRGRCGNQNHGHGSNTFGRVVVTMLNRIVRSVRETITRLKDAIIALIMLIRSTKDMHRLLLQCPHIMLIQIGMRY